MLFSKKNNNNPPKKKVICPSCQHEQWEYAEANATFCHACGTKINLQENQKNRKKIQSKVKRTTLRCYNCDHELRVPASALSSQCQFCSTHLDFQDYLIENDVSKKIITYGEIKILPVGLYSGTEARANSIALQGKSTGRLIALETISIFKKAQLQNAAQGKNLIVEASGVIKTDQWLQFESASISGSVSVSKLIIEDTLEIFPSAIVRANHLEAKSIKVYPGGNLYGHFKTRSNQ